MVYADGVDSLRHTKPRTIILPLIIIAVAAMLWGWGSRQQSETTEEVRAFVESLCRDAAVQRTTPSRPSTSAIDRAALDQLRRILDGHPRAHEPLRVEVVPGDVSDYAGGTATHTATISLGFDAVLGLRIVHPNDATQIQLIGIWTP